MFEPGKGPPARLQRRMRTGFEEVDMKKILVLSGTVMGLALSLPMQSQAQQQARSVPANQATRDIKVISSAGARALADACTAWAEQNKQVVAMAILGWGGNLIESHAVEGAGVNAVATALLKPTSASGQPAPPSETTIQYPTGQTFARPASAA